MDRASRRAGGLTDFGDPRFEDGLDHLIDSIRRTRTDSTGLATSWPRLTSLNLLRQRLLMTKHLRHHPEIRNEIIEKPIFLIGAPRTGTTITHTC